MSTKINLDSLVNVGQLGGMNSTTAAAIKSFRSMARTESDQARRDQLLASADAIDADALAPTDQDVLADKILYARLQREMETRKIYAETCAARGVAS